MLGAVALLAAGCRAPQGAGAPEQALSPKTQQLIAAADASPRDATLQRRAGVALIDTALEGQLELAPDAERYLERALRLEPHDLTAARKLSRLLNLRLVTGDFSQADRQLELFDLLRSESPDPYERFVFDCFHQMARAASLRNDGRFFAALHEVRSLEQRLEDRTDARPEEIETAAMAGNYALAFAGSLPTGRHRRLHAATGYLERQQHGWTSQSVTARGLGTAPGTRSVFAMWLAQAELAEGRVDEAKAAFAVVEREAQRDDATVAMRQLAHLATAQASAAETLAGDMSLLPAWPQAEHSCVACHSQGTALPSPPSEGRRGKRRAELVP